jgi:hypothetical protein
MKLLMLFLLPRHVTNESKIKVEFAEGSNAKLIIWMPCGHEPLIKELLRNMPGMNPNDASFYGHALEQKYEQYWKTNGHVLDPFSIDLLEPMDADKIPTSKIIANGDDFALMITLDFKQEHIE